MDYGKLEMKLRKAMESAIENGWAPMPVFALGKRGTCCAVGSLLVDKAYMHDGCIVGGENYETVAAKRLGVSMGVVQSIWKAFDNPDDKYLSCDKKAFAIGANIRRIYYDDNGQVE